MTFPIQRSSNTATSSINLSSNSQGFFAGRKVSVADAKPLLNHYVLGLSSTNTNHRFNLKPV